jgi:lipid-A-disaccharide synthase
MTNIMIVAGESSGELYGALLAKALKSRWPDLRIIGVGGRKMNEAGVELVSSISDAFGLTEAIASLSKLRIAFNSTIEALKKSKPRVLILIDYPDFNLRVAKLARSLGIKILYYVSPQVWAWRKGRVKKIAGLVDRMAVILPFEEEIYKKAGLACEFVGHPVLEEIETVLATGMTGEVLQRSPSRTFFKTVLGFDPDRPLLSLLPGSRPSELKRHLPLMTSVIRKFKGDPEMPSATEYQFCMPLAGNTDEAHFDSHLTMLKQEGVQIKKGESVRVLAASDMAVVASGTATLQTALLEVPMVVVYKLAPLSYHLGKRIIKVKYISLVNILSGREVVTELIQNRANPDGILRELKRIVSETGYREHMLAELRNIKGLFTGEKTSERVAEMVMEMAGEKDSMGRIQGFQESSEIR